MREEGDIFPRTCTLSLERLTTNTGCLLGGQLSG